MVKGSNPLPRALPGFAVNLWMGTGGFFCLKSPFLPALSLSKEEEEANFLLPAPHSEWDESKETE